MALTNDNDQLPALNQSVATSGITIIIRCRAATGGAVNTVSTDYIDVTRASSNMHLLLHRCVSQTGERTTPADGRQVRCSAEYVQESTACLLRQITFVLFSSVRSVLTRGSVARPMA